MKNRIKKFLICFSFIFLSLSALCADDGVNEYVLENGLRVFVLEDFSSALVRVEFACRAGFSNQTPSNAGFFPLYARLFKYTLSEGSSLLEGLYSECFDSSSRYIITVTSDELTPVLKAISEAAFDPVFLDSDISRELNRFKKEVKENAGSIEGFINASIDSRVFSKNPWKHDSGIYPALFSKTSVAEARAVLSNINSSYYVPDNCALFISGPVTSKDILTLAENYFSKENLRKKSVSKKEVEVDFENDKKLFVLSDPEFSPDMIQVVMQYTKLQMDRCDIASAVLNEDSSVLKQNLLSDKDLKIISAQYINAASTHKSRMSRLIIQSLMESPKKNPAAAAMSFVKNVNDSLCLFSQKDFNDACSRLSYDFKKMIDSSAHLMNLLSEYWALKDSYDLSRSEKEKTYFENLMNRAERINAQSYEELIEELKADVPFVFVFVNSKVLEKYEKTFKANGYEIVTVKNGSWYTQSLYENIKKAGEEEELYQEEELIANEDLFVEKNLDSILRFNLDNKIPVIVKERKPGNTVCVCFNIDGGELYKSKTDYGLEHVLVDCLYMNVDKILYEKYRQKIFKFYPVVTENVDLKSSSITIECLAEDFDYVIDSFYEALVFAEIIPAMADASLMERKTEQIVKTGSHVFQLKSAAVSSLFKSKELSAVYTLNQDVYKKINFSRIIENYPEFLNASRYKIIISGNCADSFKTEENLRKKLNSTLGVLAAKDSVKKINFELNHPNKKVKKVKINHVFLTDVSRDKAGPRPEVLIPTTEFLDPCQYWINYDSELSSLSEFNALLLDFADYLQKKCHENENTAKIVVKADYALPGIPFGVVTFTNVRDVASLENMYAEALAEYEAENSALCASRCKNAWIRNYLEPTLSNAGTCRLIEGYICENIDNFDGYVNDYKSVHTMDDEKIRNILPLFEGEKVFKVYSADTK